MTTTIAANHDDHRHDGHDRRYRQQMADEPLRARPSESLTVSNSCKQADTGNEPLHAPSVGEPPRRGLVQEWGGHGGAGQSGAAATEIHE